MVEWFLLEQLELMELQLLNNNRPHLRKLEEPPREKACSNKKKEQKRVIIIDI